MPTQITALGVSKSLGGRLVLDSVTCSLTAGECTGIIGENGSGKTTLLRLLAACERPDQGDIVVQADGGVGHLAQDGRLAPQVTVQQVIDRALICAPSKSGCAVWRRRWRMATSRPWPSTAT
ncbi:MAG TPA: ATP-binding cassette domain-containing protein [Actinoallomurus sp.]|jgi:macrolide transport system ATP-binding/permease protein|nr:ATP-binding cassette domain-containing protein [Actinoallomurus sp.]